jgi:hypothetical protein
MIALPLLPIFAILLWIAIAVEHNTRHRSAGALARFEAQRAAWGWV